MKLEQAVKIVQDMANSTYLKRELKDSEISALKKILTFIKQEESNEDSYWKGWIDKQNEAMKICKMCKYKDKANKYDALMQKLEADNKEDSETVKYYENARRNCTENSFYKKSYQTTVDKLNAKIEIRKEILDILEERNYKNKGIAIELSSDINKPNIGIIGGFEDGQKVVYFYKVDRSKYEPKLKLGKATNNKQDLIEFMENSELIGKLVFHHQESIESLMLILSEIYKKGK